MCRCSLGNGRQRRRYRECCRMLEFLLETFESYKWSYTYWHYYKGMLDDPLAGRWCVRIPKP